MNQAKPTFVTAISCMDGRIQEPVSRYLKHAFGAAYVDTITEAGPDGILAQQTGDLVESIRRRVEISVKVHGSEVIAVVGHHDCAGDPVSATEHLFQLETSVEVIRSWGLGVRIVGLWVNQDWQVEPKLEHVSRETSPRIRR